VQTSTQALAVAIPDLQCKTVLLSPSDPPRMAWQ